MPLQNPIKKGGGFRLRTISSDYSDLSTIVEILQKRATLHPQRVAYVFLENSEEVQSITYQELDLRAKSVAMELRLKLKKGERALLLYKPGLDYIIGFFGCLYAGIVAVPAYPPDPSRLGRMLPRLINVMDDCQPKVILTTSDISLQLKILGIRAPKLILKKWISTDKIQNISRDNYIQENLLSDDVSFLQYTSGSTGDPKGVMITHENLIHNSETISRAGKNAEGERLLTWLPLYHDMGLIGMVLQTIYSGLTTYLMSPFDFLKNPYNWLYSISKYKISASGGPNFGYHLCYSKITDAQKKNLDLSSWKLAYSGAEPVRAETMNRFFERFMDVGFSSQSFYPCYGLAESTVFVSGVQKQKGYTLQKINLQSLKNGKVDSEKDEASIVEYVSSGRSLMEDTVIKIVNPETKKECAVGEVGEIWISSPSVAKGYWGKEALTREVFYNSLVEDNLKYMRSGDLAFADAAGEIYVTGRMKDLIIVNGLNHYPSDIEETVLKASREVRAGCLAAISIKDHVSEKVLLVAELKKELSNEQMQVLRSRLNQAVFTKHELALSDIIFIKTGSIPKTTSGKIQRNSTREAYLKNQLQLLNSDLKNVKKRTTFFGRFNFSKKSKARVEEIVLELLAQELKQGIQNFSSQSQFSEIGLSSLQAVSLAASLSKHFKIEISPALFWSYKDISSLAKYISSRTEQSPVESFISNHVTVDRSEQEEIAIVGMSGRFPDAENIEQFWNNLNQGKDSVSKLRGGWAGYVRDIDKFDPLFFGISPREAEVMDPQQRLVLEVAWEALERAGISPTSLNESNTGVFLGVSSTDYLELVKSQKKSSDLQMATGNAHSIVANRISFLLNFKGPSLSIDTACSSSLVALHEAIKSLRMGDCKLALAGGVNALLDESITETFAKAGMLSPDGRCFTFDKRANGYVRGEGCGVVVLKPLSQAIKDKNPILGIIRASGIEHGGHTNSLTAPSSISQAELIERTYLKSQVHPKSVGYVEAHGTATKLGDPIELLGLQMAFENLENKMAKYTLENSNPCLIGSVKSNIGHLEAAAGIAGLIKTLLMIEHKVIPATLHFTELNPAAQINSKKLAVAAKKQSWETSFLRRAGVSSFGFGGMNAHVVVEEYPKTSEKKKEKFQNALLLISAQTPEQLTVYIKRFVEYLRNTEENLENIAYTSQVARESYQYRVAIIGSSHDEWIEKLESQKFLKGQVKKNTNKEFTSETEPLKIAEAWCRGMACQWEKLYSRLPSLSLIPTYPFEKKRYWVTSIQENSFSEKISLDRFFIKDHIVVDKNIMPGVVHLEMVRKAAAEKLQKKAYSLSQIFWKQPVVVGANPLNLGIGFEAQSENIYKFQITSHEMGEKIYSQGVLSTSPNVYDKIKTAEAFLIMREKIKTFELKHDVYEHFSQLGLHYGPSFQCIKKIYCGELEAYAELNLDEAHQIENENFELHPSLMDAALGSCIGIKELNQGSRDQVYIPFSLERIDIYKSVQGNCWAHAQLSSDTGSLAGDFKKYDVTVFSDHGEILVKFVGAVVRPVKLLQAIAPNKLLELERSWVPDLGETQKQRDFKDILLINFSSEQVEEFKKIAEVRVRELDINPNVNLSQQAIKNLMNTLPKGAAKPWLVAIDLEKFRDDTALKFVFELYRALAEVAQDLDKVIVVPILKKKTSFEFSRQAEVRGFFQSLKKFHPKIEMGLITFDEQTILDPSYCDILLKEFRRQSASEVFYRNSERFESALVKVTEPGVKMILKEGGTYVISGGAGGIGQILARHLIEKWDANVILLGRKKKDLLPKIIHGQYRECDITNSDDVRDVLNSIIEENKEIHGIVHSAGSVNLKSIFESTWEEYSRTLSAKVQGALVLDEESAHMKLDFFMVTSSISSFMGDFGAGDYASANAFLDEFTQIRHELVISGERQGKSLCGNWPLWESGGMSMPDEQKKLAETVWGLEALPNKLALEAFEKSLSRNSWQSIFLYGNSKKIQKNLLTAAPQALEKTVPANAQTKDTLRQILSETLKIDHELIDFDADFAEYGADSMTMVDFMDKIQKIYGDVVTPAVLFENKTINSLAKILGVSTSAPPVEKKPVKKLDVQQVHSLSQAQQAMWFIYEIAPESHAYNIPMGLKVRGAFKKSQIKRALEILAQEQPLLRSLFVKKDDIKYLILENSGVALSYLKAEHLNEVQIQKLVLQEGQRPFDLLEETGFRVALIERDKCEFDLIMIAHHIIFDGLSLMIILKRFIEILYNLTQDLPTNSILIDEGYFKFTQDQVEFLNSESAESQKQYWISRLTGELPALQLPTDRPRPTLQSYNGSTLNFDLNFQIYEEIKGLAKSQKVTVNSLLLSAFYLFLNKYSGQDDIIVGSPVLGRSHENLKTVGYFVNMMALRERIQGDQLVIQFVQAVHQNMGSALMNQNYPFPLLVSDLNQKHDPSRSPLFQSCFVFQNMLKDPLFEKSLEPRDFEYFHIPQQEGQFDLELEVLDSQNALTCHLKYNTDLFDELTIQRFAKSYEVIVLNILKNKNQKISEISVLDEDDLDLIARQFNNTKHDYRSQLALHELFEKQVEKTPQAVAVKYQDQSLTYQELNEKSNQLARHLVHQGIKAEDFVGVCATRSLEMVISLYAILKAGAAYVPVEPTYPIKRIEFLFKDSKFSYILTQNQHKSAVAQYGGRFLCVDTEWNQVQNFSKDNLSLQVTQYQLAYMIYTSGSTGEPKGAMNTHGGICNRLLWMQKEYQLKAQDTILHKTPFSFDVSVWEFFWPLIAGAKLVLLEPEAHKEADRVADIILQEKVTTLHFVPSMLSAFLEQHELKDRCHSLRRVICSGEALSIDLQRKFFKIFSCELHNLYGPTEASVDVTYWACQKDTQLTFVPIGRPIDNIQISIVDQFMKPVPIGCSGELLIAGIGLARGYHNRHQLNDEKFILNPFDIDQKTRFYRTGDLARYSSEGVIEYLGRIDNQVKIRGFRIELGEIEYQLCQNSLVHECVVIARSRGTDEKELVAYIVTKNQSEILVKDLKLGLLKELPDYMIPAKFVFLKKMPLSSNGKVDRKLLPEPQTSNEESRSDVVLPRNETEEKILFIWQKNLGINEISVTDSFFDLGGSSLLSIRVVALINGELKTSLSIRDFYENPTIEALATRIKEPSKEKDISPILLADAILDSNINYRHHQDGPRQFLKIFLTGATGFLGAYLLRDLLESTNADVLCLVRCSNSWDGSLRLQKNLEKYNLWKTEYRDRVYAIPGDLGKPHLGLDRFQWSYLIERVQAVYHNGAKVNFVQPYSYLKNENVKGTEEVLRLCAEGIPKILHYISTVSVFDSSVYKKADLLEESVKPVPQGLFSGYAQSKWVAEQLVSQAQDRGLQASIYRPGTVSGDSVSGISNPDDLMTRLLVAAVQLECWPELDRNFDMVPVDFVSQAIVRISQSNFATNESFHIVNPKPLKMKELQSLYRELGYSFPEVKYSDWVSTLIKNQPNALSVLLPLFSEKVSGTNMSQAQLSTIKPAVTAPHTFAIMKKLGIVCPEVRAELIRLYLSASLPQFLQKKSVS